MFLRSNRVALYRGGELMSLSSVLGRIAVVTQLDRNKASLYLNSLIFTTNRTVLPWLFFLGGGRRSVRRGEVSPYADALLFCVCRGRQRCHAGPGRARGWVGDESPAPPLGSFPSQGMLSRLPWLLPGRSAGLGGKAGIL